MRVPSSIFHAFLIVSLFVLGFPKAFSASAESIDIKTSDGAPPILAYLYKPSGKGPYPGVFVLHQGVAQEIENVKELSEDLSDKGFVTLAVDFTSRPWIDSHFSDAYDYLNKLPEVYRNRIAFVGLSRGARLGMGVATYWKNEQPPRPLRAFVSYYIGNSIDTMPTPDLPPILFLHGENDPEVKPDLIGMFCDMQKQLGGVCEAKIYEGTSHAFDRDTPYGSKDHQATSDAFKRTVAFLNKYLRDGKTQ